MIKAGVVLEKDQLFCSLAVLWVSGLAVMQSEGLRDEDRLMATGVLVAAVQVSASST